VKHSVIGVRFWRRYESNILKTLVHLLEIAFLFFSFPVHDEKRNFAIDYRLEYLRFVAISRYENSLDMLTNRSKWEISDILMKQLGELNTIVFRRGLPFIIEDIIQIYLCTLIGDFSLFLLFEQSFAEI
jgi:hypothetical protein